MSDARFEASWLELREPVDHRSRPMELLPPLVEAWRVGGWSRVADLGSGIGSNLRYLLPHLPGDQSWTLVDHDEALLVEAARRHGESRSEVPVETVVGDLSGAGLDAAGDAHLVTASALLDLVSREWLERLVEAVSARGGGVLLALSYDGRVQWSGPPHPDDHLVRAAVNRHQKGDKGLGPALGPAAAATARRLLGEAGYRTWLRPSPWTLTPRDRALGELLVDGWADAAREIHPDEAERLDAWARHRRRSLASEAVTVGHLDVLALP